MPGFLLHSGANVVCMHTGQARPVSGSPRVKVGGRMVVTQSEIYSITGCTMTYGPCATAQWTSAALRVRAGGVPVLLQDSMAICAPTGTGLTVISTQTRVRGK